MTGYTDTGRLSDPEFRNTRLDYTMCIIGMYHVLYRMCSAAKITEERKRRKIRIAMVVTIQTLPLVDVGERRDQRFYT